MKGNIIVRKLATRNFIDTRNRFLAFRNNAPLTNCIWKINNVLIDNAEDLDIVMLMYNLLEYSKNYRKTTGTFWNYCSDGTNDFTTTNYNANPIKNGNTKYYKLVEWFK